MDLKQSDSVEDNLDFVYQNLSWAWLDMAKDYADFRVLETKDNARIINEYAGDFFGRIQGVLLEFVLFQMFRITDQKGKGENQNITVKALPDYLENGDKDKIESLIKEVDDIIEPLRRYRNKVAVHNDREYQLMKAKKAYEKTNGTGIGEVTVYWAEGPNEPLPSSVFSDLGPIVVHGKQYPHTIPLETVSKSIDAISAVLKSVSGRVDYPLIELYWEKANKPDGVRADELVENLRKQRNQNRSGMKPIEL